jgi:hypothetical protein
MSQRPVRVATLFHTGNLLAALCSLETFAQKRGTPGGETVFCLYSPGMPPDILDRNARVIDAVLASLGIGPCRVLHDADLPRFGGDKAVPDPEERERLRQWLGVPEAGEVHYAHDVVGRAAELLMRAYPDACRITFGDALGSVYNKAAHLANALDEPIASVAARLPKHGFQATEACLVLPIDQYGDSLTGKTLHVVPRERVLDVVARCAAGLPELDAGLATLLERSSPPRCLFLLENLTDADFIAFDRELALQERMVRAHAPPGACVILKPHPLSVSPMADALAARLADTYTVVPVAPELCRYPVELWARLVRSCQVIAWSYSALSLRYLYGQRVVYALEPEMIETYFEPRMWEFMKDSRRLMVNPLQGLDTWDGSGPLYSGTLPPRLRLPRTDGGGPGGGASG